MPSSVLIYGSVGNVGIAAFGDLGRQGQLLIRQRYFNWRASWDLIASSHGAKSDRLLLYDREDRLGAFYDVDRRGAMTPLAEYRDWRASWTHLVAGRFGASGAHTFLLYDAPAGDAAFITSNDDGSFETLAYYDDWTQWSHVAVGSLSQSGRDDLLLYQQASGWASWLQVRGGRLASKAHYEDWNRDWSHLAVLSGARSPILLLYAQATGTAHFASLNSDGSWQGVPRVERNWRTSWSHLSAARTERSARDGFLLYDRTDGTLSVFAIADRLQKRDVGTTQLPPGARDATHVIEAAAPGAPKGERPARPPRGSLEPCDLIVEGLPRRRAGVDRPPRGEQDVRDGEAGGGESPMQRSVGTIDVEVAQRDEVDVPSAAPKLTAALPTRRASTRPTSPDMLTAPPMLTGAPTSGGA